MMNKKIILASNNKGKLKEIAQILLPFGYEIISQKEAGINVDIEEIGTTFKENAILKAKAIYDLCKCPVISDDSGLEVDYLNGAPGVYSHRYAGENATDEDRCQKLINEMINAESRNAKFVCVICFINEDGIIKTVSGECKGVIGTKPIGTNGFGYDPIFMYGKSSFAQLPAEIKNSVSHRAEALKKLRELLNQ